MNLIIFLRLLHFVGLGLALGAATTKLVLLGRARADRAVLAAFLAVAPAITRLILLGTGLLVVSGIIWLLAGYPLGGLLIAKVILVAIAFVVGGAMARLIEPRFFQLAPKPADSISPEFSRVYRQYLAAEGLATGLYYFIVIVWVLRGSFG